MKVYYDDIVDALYIELGNKKPDGVVEIAEGINLDLTKDNKVIGIEILGASQKMDITTILSYSIELNKEVFQPAG